MPRGTKIGEEEKELARGLLAMGKSYREVAEAMELSVGSVHNIAKEPMERVEPMVAEIKRRFAMKHWLLADHILARITPENVAGASLKEKALAAAILTDKALALENGLRPGGPSMPEAEGVAICPEVVGAGLGDERRMNTREILNLAWEKHKKAVGLENDEH